MATMFENCNDYRYWSQFSRKFPLGSDEWGIICHQGSGDTYIICALGEMLLKYVGGSSIAIFAPESHKEIVEHFPHVVSRFIAFPNDFKFNIEALQRYSVFMPGNMIIGNIDYFGNGRLHWLLGYKDINYVDLFRHAFHLPWNVPVARPKLSRKIYEDAFLKFQKYGLSQGKTVILVPHAISLEYLPHDFWHQMAILLKNRGWDVCTSVFPQSPNPIEGTIPISFSRLESIPMSEFAGWVISARSGYCDLISSANCKLSILYPYKKIAGNDSTWFKCFNLRAMGLSNTANEYEYTTNENWVELINRIVLEE